MTPEYKKFCLLPLVIFLSVSAFAQNTGNGAFAGPVFQYTKLAGQPALIVGGKVGWIINKGIVLGAGYYALTSNVSSNYINEESNQNLLLDFNYGGLEFEYLVLRESRYNLTINILMAGGGLNFYLNNNSKRFSGRNLLLWEPRLNFEVELYEWLHADAGISYRLISSYTELYDVTQKDLQGINILLTLKFGDY
jgi:hypothetical protein